MRERLEGRREDIITVVSVVAAVVSIYILSIYPVSGVIVARTDKWYSLVYLVLLFKLFGDLLRCKDRRLLAMALSVGLIYALCIVSGQYTYWYGQDMYNAGNSLCLLLVLFLIFAGLIVQFMKWPSAYDCREKEWGDRIHDRRFFLLSWLLIILCWVPAFLAVYPGVFSYDANPEVLQLFRDTGVQLSSHHPLIHTLFLCGSIKIGELLFGSYNAGVAVYSVLQGALLSSAFAFALLKLKKLKTPAVLMVVSFLFFAVNPIMQIFAFVTTKDVLFAAAFLVLLILLYELLEDFEGRISDRRWLIFYAVIAVFMCLFRNQGIYVFAFMSIFLFFLLKRSRKMLCINLGVILAVMILNGPLLSLTGVEKGDAREMLSVPMQQIARVYNLHTLSEEEKELAEELIPRKYLKDYTPMIADPVKSGFNTNVLKKNMGTYLKLWAKLGIRYPKEYIVSFLYGCAGYYYIDETVYWDQYIYFDGALKDSNILNIERDSKFPQYEQYLRNQAYLLEYKKIPVVSLMLHQAFPFWLMVLCGALAIYRKKYEYLIPLLLLLGYWGTLLLGPVTGVRYALPLMVCVPILLEYIYHILKGGNRQMMN